MTARRALHSDALVRRRTRLWSASLAIMGVLLAGACLAVASPARAADDTTPPQVTAFNIAPAVFNTEFADQTVTVTMTLTDDQSGVATMADGGRDNVIMFEPPSGRVGQLLSGTPTRISGDDHNGVYTATVTFPCGSAAGGWNAYLALCDKAGNTVTLFPADLAAKFGAGCATATNTATTSDTTPPEITALSITPKEFNTESADQTLTVTMTLTDAQSGVSRSDVQLTPAVLPSAGGYQLARCLCTRISGDDHSGVYAGTITVPKWSKEGAWQVHVLTLSDKLGNQVQLTPADLAARFGAGCATVTNTATISDTTPPQITALSITPKEFNTESADQTLTVAVTLTDAQSGLSLQGDSGGGGSGAVCSLELMPLVSNQNVSGMFTRISGDDHDGVYAATLTLPKSSKEGVWLVDDLRLVDKVGNMVELRPDALNALLPGADSLVVNTATAQQVTIDRLWTISTGKYYVTFPAGTVVTRADNGRFAFYEMTAQQFTLDDSIPTAGLDGTPVATLKFGIPGLNLSFSQPVTVSMYVGSAYEGYCLSIQSLTEGGTAWANETSCIVLGGQLQFTVSHATKFVANLTKTSVPKPSLTRLSPTSGKRGATVTITGKDFGTGRGTSTVTFGTTVCTQYVSWLATRIKVKVPAKAAFGSLKVTVKTTGGTSNAKNFTVKR